MPAEHSYPKMVLEPGDCPTCREPMTAGVLWAGGRQSSAPYLRDTSEPDPPVHVAWGVWCERCGPALAAQVVTVNSDPLGHPHVPWLRVGLTPTGEVVVDGAGTSVLPAQVARALGETIEILATDLPEARGDRDAAAWSLYRDEGSSSAYADGPKGAGPQRSRCMVKLGWVRAGSSCYGCGTKLEDWPDPMFAFVLAHDGDAAWVVAVGDENPYVCTGCVASAKLRTSRTEAAKPVLRLVASPDGSDA